MTRGLGLALAALLLAGSACGKYGPPVRSAGTPPPKTPPVAAAPASAAAGAAGNTEECADPNAPGAPNAAAGAAP